MAKSRLQSTPLLTVALVKVYNCQVTCSFFLFVSLEDRSGCKAGLHAFDLKWAKRRLRCLLAQRPYGICVQVQLTSLVGRPSFWT